MTAASSSLIGSAGRAGEAHTAELEYEIVDARFVWVADRGRRVGLVDREKATLEWIAPHPRLEPPRTPCIPPVYHAPAFQGGRIVMQWWLDDGAGQRVDASQPLSQPFGVLRTHPKSRRPRTTVQLTHVTNELPIGLIATHVYTGDDRIAGFHRVRLGYDATLDSYVADVEAELVAPDPYLTEFCNLYAGGVYDNRPRHKRYQCTIWQHPDGRLARWDHNPVSYLAPGMNDRHGERQIATGGLLGFFADPFSNPVVQILQSDPPAAAATCCNLYDEHLLCHAPRASADGLYRWRARFRFFSLPPDQAQPIVAQSQPVNLRIEPDHLDSVLLDPMCDDRPLGQRYLHNPQFPLFEFGRVNDFESPVPLGQMVVGNMIWASANAENPVYWENTVGHSGSRSIRLRGDAPHPIARTRLAGGPSLHLVGGEHYRLGGWVRTRDVLGAGASIRMDVIGLHSDQSQLAYRAGPCRDATQWTYVETVFQVPHDAELGWLYLELEGPGMAWFDDIMLEKS